MLRSLSFSQSAVSYHVKKLEEELGFRLLNRDTHKVVLTPAGESFYKEVVALKDRYLMAAAKSLALEKSEENYLRISWQIFEIPMLLSALISTINNKFPGLQIELTLQTNSNSFEELTEMRKDIIFLYEENFQPDPRVIFMPLWTINNYLVVNSKNPLASKEHIEIEDLDGQVLFVPLFTPETRTANEVYSAILKRFPGADIRMLSDFQFVSIPQVIANNGLALYPLPRNFPDVGVVSRPFAHCIPMVVGIAYRTDDSAQKISFAINLIKQFFENSVTG